MHSPFLTPENTSCCIWRDSLEWPLVGVDALVLPEAAAVRASVLT